MMNTAEISIDNSIALGGGQVLRTALSLSAITGKSFHMKSIRARRKKPGLMRQHITAIKAVAEVCDAQVKGVELGSTEVCFDPGTVRGGEYRFDIGTAGSTSLVAQTLIPILSFAEQSSAVCITGGTHALWAPTFDYLEQTFLPIFAKMGGKTRISLSKYGFFPAGGGEIRLQIEPVNAPKPLKLIERGDRVREQIVAVVSHVKANIATREIDTIATALGIDKQHCRTVDVRSPGAGNVVSLFLHYQHITETFFAIGQYCIRAETLANLMAEQARRYMLAQDAAGTHYVATESYLADQLLLPMALCTGGVFSTMEFTDHSRANIDIIRRFLDVKISFTQTGRSCWNVEVKPA